MKVPKLGGVVIEPFGSIRSLRWGRSSETPKRDGITGVYQSFPPEASRARRWDGVGSIVGAVGVSGAVGPGFAGQTHRAGTKVAAGTTHRRVGATGHRQGGRHRRDDPAAGTRLIRHR